MKITGILIFVLLSPLTILAQGKDFLWYNQLTQKEGLNAEEYNFYSYQDSEGFIWVNSVEGLNRFDGNTVKVYRTDFQDSTSLFGENIGSNFFETPDKNIWFATYQAVHCYNRKTDNFRHYTINDSLGKPITEEYNVLHLEQDSILWFRNWENIYRMNIHHPSNYQKVYSTKYYHAFFGSDSTGNVNYIISCGNKHDDLQFVSIQDGKKVKSEIDSFPIGEKKEKISFHQAYIEDYNNIWLGSEIGLIKWDAESDEHKIIKKQVNTFCSVVPFDEDHLVISFYDNKLWKVRKSDSSLSEYRIHSAESPTDTLDLLLRNIFVDRNQNIWMTTFGKGLIFANPRKAKFQSISKQIGSGIENILRFNSFAEAADGSIWASHRDGILVFDKNTEQKKTFPLRSITSDTSVIKINKLLKTNSGEILIATNNGCNIYNPKTAHFDSLSGTDKLNIEHLLQLQNGDVLASSPHQGVFALRIKNKVADVQKIHSKNFTSIYEDQAGQVYLCNNESKLEVYAYQSGQLKLQHSIQVFGSIYDYFEDIDGRHLWVGSAFGLLKIDKQNPNSILQSISMNDGLPDNGVFVISSKSASEFWLSTGNGIVLFNKKTLSIEHFEMEDGMLSNRFDKYASLRLRDGTTWLGGENGITIIPSELPAVLDIDTKIIFSEIKIDEMIDPTLRCENTGVQNVNQIQSIEKTYKQNTISFRFVATDYSAPKATQLQYQLIGLEKKWVDGKEGFAKYPNLKHGRYQFQVRAANSEGIWKVPRTIDLYIRPPFWMTLWFKIVCGLIIAGVITLFVRTRIERARKTSELKAQIAENKMSALLAQMNPHFIFNSLQSINRFVLKNEKRQASEYLGRFSKLMRMILEGSRHNSHSIQQEVDLLNLYLRVEAQRFQKPFDYLVEVDEEIDPYETFIPAMMLQPFVENAIWHGVSSRDANGKIKVEINQIGGLIKCTVEDNGIGRKRASEIADKKGKTHTSRAIQIITERLDLLFADQKHLCSIQYIDLKDELNQPAGTRAEIMLPPME